MTAVSCKEERLRRKAIRFKAERDELLSHEPALVTEGLGGLAAEARRLADMLMLTSIMLMIG